MTELDPQLRNAVDELRAGPAVRPQAREQLREAILRERQAPVRRGRSPDARALALSPLRAAFAAALLVLATSAGWFTVLKVTQRGAAGAPDAAAVVQFVLIASGAERVSLVGDFNDWDPQATPLTPSAGGVWSVVLPLASGRFSYSFLVDEREWRADPNAPHDADDFGRPTSVVYVPRPETAP